MKMYYTKFDTPIGGIVLIGDENGLGVLHIETSETARKANITSECVRNDDFFCEIKRQLDLYFESKLTNFSVKLNPKGSEFQKNVWNALSQIPFGKLVTYGEIANWVGNPKASRAVGAANGKNPIPIIVPCHRVIGSNGKLTGFAYGLEIKQKLIDIELKAIR